MPPRLIGPSAPPCPHGAILDALEGDRPWLVFHLGRTRRILSTGEAALLARGWAAAFAREGVGREDRVLLLAPNGPEFVGAFLGARLLGATPVPLAWPMFPGALAALAPRLMPLVALAGAKAVAMPEGELDLGLPLVRGPADGEARAAQGGLAFVQFTSGTTSRPKGAMISERAALGSAWRMGEALGLGPADVGVSWLPLFHDMGLVGALLCSLVRGFVLHLLRPAEFLLRPERWIALLEEQDATITVAPNSGYALAARRAAARALPRLRHALSGSEPVHRSTIDAFEARFEIPGRTRPVYGLAENTLGVSFGLDRAPDLARDQRILPSVGGPLADMAIEVREASRALEEGEVGELFVAGPTLMDGYLDDAEATRAALHDGWLATGDLGLISGGKLYIAGRRKDLVIKGGVKFHPYEIEALVAERFATPPNGVVAYARANDLVGREDLVVALEVRGGVADADKEVRALISGTLGVSVDEVRVLPPGTLPRTTSGKLRRGACPAAVEARP